MREWKREREREKEKSPETKLNTTYETVNTEKEEDTTEIRPQSAQKQRHQIPEQNFFKDLAVPEPTMPKMDLIEIDDSFLNSPIQIPERIAAKMSKPFTPPVVVPETAEDSEVHKVIRELGSTNINVAFQASSKVRAVLETQARSTLTTYADSIMDSLTTQLKLLNSYTLEKYGLILPQTYRMVFRILDDIFGKKTSMGVIVKVHHLQMVLRELLYILVEDKTAKFAEGGYNKWINIFVVKIIEDSDHTNVTCAILKLLYDIVGNPHEDPKMGDLASKCLIKVCVLIKKPNSNWLESLDLNEVFYECNLFFHAYPKHTWKDRPSMMPLKAVKTLLLTFVTLKGKDVFLYLKKIENSCASELAAYLKRLLRSQPVTGKSSNVRLSKGMSDYLSEIFMKISYEETAKEGLLQFYEFKKRHPNLDLSWFLAPTSQYFRDYVEDGLRSIEKERGELDGSPNSGETGAETYHTKDDVENHSAETGTGLAQYYLNKLREYQTRVGFKPTDLPDFKTES